MHPISLLSSTLSGIRKGDGKSHALIHQYDALLAGETDETKQTQLREEANNKIAEMLKKETGATLHKVLFELSNQMKTRIPDRMRKAFGGKE